MYYTVTVGGRLTFFLTAGTARKEAQRVVRVLHRRGWNDVILGECSALSQEGVTPEAILATLPVRAEVTGSAGGRKAARSMTQQERRRRAKKAAAVRWTSGRE